MFLSQQNLALLRQKMFQNIQQKPPYLLIELTKKIYLTVPRKRRIGHEKKDSDELSDRDKDGQTIVYDKERSDISF